MGGLAGSSGGQGTPSRTSWYNVAILTFEEILTLIDKISEKEISLVEIESGGLRLRIEGNRTAGERQTDVAVPQPAQLPLPSPASPPRETAPEPPAEEDETGLHIVTAPIVGTFYRSPNPESEAFVKEGDRVSKGKVLCIIEAMKLFNEIESDADGVITRIYPQNGQPVEYGEKLFAIRPS